MTRDEAIRTVATWWLRDFLDEPGDVHDTFLWEDVPELDQTTYDEVLDDMAAMIVRPSEADYRAAYDLISTPAAGLAAQPPEAARIGAAGVTNEGTEDD